MHRAGQNEARCAVARPGATQHMTGGKGEVRKCGCACLPLEGEPESAAVAGKHVFSPTYNTLL